MKITKTLTKNFVRKQLSTSEKWAKAALIKIYSFQTEEEQAYGDTITNNNIGFSGSDADILSSFAKQLLSKGWLSPKQMKIVFKKMPKYSRQIIENSNTTTLNNLILKSI